MKKIKIVVLILSMAVLGMVSCTDQLDEKIYSELIISNAYETKEDAQALVLSVYAALRGTDWGTYYEYDYLLVSESGTDTYGQDDWDPGVQKLEVGIWDNNYDAILNLWDGAYKVISAANLAINILEEMPIDEGAKAGFIGEAKFLRGLAYYDLAFNFGDVILNIGESNENLPLSTQAEVIAQVLSDLSDAASKLGEATTPGRASKGAALGLRAKTNLNAKNWAEAAADAKAVMDLGEHTLFSSVEGLFDAANQKADEWIFAVMSTQDGTGPATQLAWHVNSLNYMNAGWGRLTLSPGFYNSFEIGDERRNLIGNGYQHGGKSTDDDDKFRYYALPGTPEYADLMTDPTISITDLSSLTATKYMAGQDRFSDALDPAYLGINYPILRFADILLTRAEALNETGSTADAMILVNEVRSRSNAILLVGMDQSTLRDAILEERGKELFMEGHRRLDLIRSGRYIDLWKANLEAKYPGSDFGYLNESKIFFPIPQKEIDANDQID